MANKPFEIQSSSLLIGGVELAAGTTSIVIPGVTRAASYRVEEVEETVEQTNTLNLPIVIDNVTHTAKVADPAASTLAYATYTVELDDEDYIDEIEVNTAGTYVGSEVDRNGDFDMWGYIGSDAEGYFPNWVTSDWVQIPFRPKMRADDVELEGGGGSLTVGNGTNTSIQNVTEILINGQITQVDDGVVGITILSGNGLTDITGAQIGNQITINTTIDGATPDLENASSIDYIPTSTLNDNDWIGSGTNDSNTYSEIRFANGNTFLISGWNTDAYPDTGNGTSGFLTLDASGLFYTGAEVWPITITSYDYVAGTTAGRGIEDNGYVWKFDEDGILTVPGEIQSRGLNNLVLRSKDNINLYAGDVPGDDSEGGDINIYAGKGDPDNSGGDVQIRGGEGGDLYGQFNTGNTGGYVQLRGGYSVGTSNGGYVELTAGSSDRGQGGEIRIRGGGGSDNMLKLDNVAITDISLDTPVLVTLAVDHNLNYGDAINFANITTTTQLNNTKYYVIVAGNNTVTLFQDRALTIPVSGAGMTPYSSPGTLTVTATSVNAQQNNYFSQYIANAPEIGSVQVGWTVTGPGLNGTKTVIAVNPVDPVVITVDGSDGSVFSEFQSYTFAEPSITGFGTAYTSAHGGDITLQPGSTYDSSWGDIGRTFIRGETQIGNEGGNIWEFSVDGALTLPSGSPILFGNGNSRIQAGMGFHINSEEGISLESVNIADPLNPVSYSWYFGPNGNINLPSGSIISETASTISIAPPTAAAGQSLVIRPTAALWSVDSSGVISYGNPITISVTLSSFPYFGTINYEITGPGVTEQTLGRPTTGKLTFAGIPSIDTQTVTWTIPANSSITEFTFTITSVDGTRSTDIQIENDPALYYSFEFNAMPVGYYVTVTNDNITNLEFSHVHLVAGDPATVDLYLGDDDQFVKIEKNGGNVVVGTNANTKNWTFGSNGQMTFPQGTVLAELVSGPTNAFGIFANAVPGRNALIRTQPSSAGFNYDWEFGNDGVLTLPNTGKVAVNGVTATYLANSETAYNDSQGMYFDAVFQWARIDNSFSPIWFNLPGRLAYDQIISWTPPAGVTPVPANIVVLANACKMNYAVWQEAIADSKLTVKSDTVNWEFDSAGKLTLPQGGAIAGGEAAAIQAAYTAWQEEEAGWEAVITTGGADLNIRPWNFAGPSPEEKLATVNAMWMEQQRPGTILDWVPISASHYNEARAWLAFTSNTDGYRLWKKLTTGVTITADEKSWAFTNDGAITFPDNTVQTTAWSGGRVVSAPVSSIGAVGDKQNDLAFNGSYIYYCTADYSDGLSNIWKRVAWSGDTW